MPYKCQCEAKKYFNFDNEKCENVSNTSLSKQHFINLCVCIVCLKFKIFL
jgi:hypothetical protein